MGFAGGVPDLFSWIPTDFSFLLAPWHQNEGLRDAAVPLLVLWDQIGRGQGIRPPPALENRPQSGVKGPRFPTLGSILVIVLCRQTQCVDPMLAFAFALVEHTNTHIYIYSIYIYI